METDKDMFKFFIEFIFLDHCAGGFDVKVNIVRKYLINRFHKAIPAIRILITFSLIDDFILKLHKEVWKKYKLMCIQYVKM